MIYTREQAYKETLKYFEGDELATNVFLDKYALKDREGNFYELTPSDMHHRLAKEFARIEQKYQNPISEDKIFELIDRFKFIVPGGSPMEGIGNDFRIQSLSNCYVIGNEEDSYGSILKIDEEQVHIMRRRGGVGSDLSHLRPKGAFTTCAAHTSTGVVPFAERYSNSTRETAQDGRRGARMLSLDITHPDAEEFIDSKLELKKITGSNISIRITDDFIQAVKEDRDFIQSFPIDVKIYDFNDCDIQSYYHDIEYLSEYNSLERFWDEKNNRTIYFKKIKAKKLWNKIIHNAWKSAEPGILFIDHIRRESPSDCYGTDWKTVSSNPCFVGETKILTKDGFKTIESMMWTKNSLIENKDRRVFFNHNNELVSGRVWSNGFKPIIELTLSNGNTIKCTPDHKFMLDNGSTEIAKNLINCSLQSFNNFNIYVSKIEDKGEIKEVFDFNLDEGESHWGIIEGVIAHNCGEIPMNAYSSCILLCLNLYSYVNDKFTENSHFNFELFKYHVGIAQRLVDDIVDLEIEQIDKILNKVQSDPESEDTKIREINLWNKIKQKIQEGRRTGLGITAEGDMLAALGLRYGTEEATQFSEELHKIMAVESYKSSINLAKERGCFPIWDYEKEKDNTFINRIVDSEEFGIYDIAQYQQYGRRNIANLTIAPTGTTSLMTQTTSGIEPCFQPFYKRRRKINDKSKASFIDEQGDMWEEYKVFHHKFVEWFKIRAWNDLIYKSDRFALLGKTPLECLNNLTTEQLEEFVKESPYYKATSSDVDYIGKVELQGRIQKWIDHSISVTVNMPEDVTEDTVSKVYMKAYESGCKGITVYREGSRSGVLISDKNEEKQSTDDIIYNHAPKRPKTLKCDVYSMSRGKQAYTIIVGLLDSGKPYEIFALEKLSSFEFNEKITKAELRKVKSRTYQLIGFHKDQKYIVDNIVDHMSDDEKKDTRKYSIQLRHGIHPKYIREQINEYASISSFDKVVDKALSNYMGEEKIKGEEACPSCGGELRYESGCVQCVNPECGWSKCS